jgi:putative ABC transport system ATP-binding protein
MIPSMSRPPVIALWRVEKDYASGDNVVHALRKISLVVEPGDFVAVMGASGSGKSTLMNVIGCLDVPSRGYYWLDGVDVRSLDEAALARVRSRKIGFVFQAFNLIPRTSALENVELPLVYAGLKAVERRQRALAALAAVGLSGREHHLPSALSGGQQQRVAIARAVVTNPSLLLADEPTGNLDSHSQAEVMDLFSQVSAAGRTIVLITHEHDVAEYAKRVVEIRDGKIIDDRRVVPVGAPPPAFEPGRAMALRLSVAGADKGDAS